MAGARTLQQMEKVINERIAAGPKAKKPGEFSASDWAWWDDFWKSHKGSDTHEIEKDIVERDSPQRKSAAKAAHEMSDEDLKRYVEANGLHKKPSGRESAGREMIRDVVRIEFRNRGMGNIP